MARFVRRRRVIGADHVITVVFQPVLTLFAMFTTVDNAADTDQIARRMFFYLITNGYHTPHNFMTRYAGVNRPRPLGTDLVEIGMADATVSDFDFDIIRSRFTPCDIHRFKWLFSGICTNSFDLHCVYS
ncbi:Uncharacterised protein [Shigella sonnei]|nr:Uncharacterised protein [Shigella sonnei]CSG61170.1 Uncharacterised protein [Shigella sonnei]CSG72292.1 Uncharacterised protein [Shigella sonnei]CSP67869.1 Uncharacterised protein [Shigella sonnei]CSQ74351.1 Uncharacterised protein [Shigella sonnei]